MMLKTQGLAEKLLPVGIIALLLLAGCDQGTALLPDQDAVLAVCELNPASPEITENSPSPINAEPVPVAGNEVGGGKDPEGIPLFPGSVRISYNEPPE